MKKFAALLLGRDDGHLDHLAPLSAELGIPLYFSSKTLFQIAKSQYPDLKAEVKPLSELPNFLISNYDNLISTLPKELLDPIFMIDELSLNKTLTYWWLPHGNSDKKNLEGLINETHLLVYGQQMIDNLPEHLKNRTHLLGNFRKRYFNKHERFYETLINYEKPAVLYAPSWEAKDIPQWIESLHKHLPKNHHLYVKLHPNTYNSPIGKALLERSSIHYIQDFYPIYPLLSKMDILFTDISSIGYDFLAFDKPIFFTCKNNDDLHKCGAEININNPYQQIETDTYSSQRRELYNKTFESKVNSLQFM